MIKNQIINEIDDEKNIGDIEEELNEKYRDFGMHLNKNKDSNKVFVFTNKQVRDLRKLKISKTYADKKRKWKGRKGIFNQIFIINSY